MLMVMFELMRSLAQKVEINQVALSFFFFILHSMTAGSVDMAFGLAHFFFLLSKHWSGVPSIAFTGVYQILFDTNNYPLVSHPSCAQAGHQNMIVSSY